MAAVALEVLHRNELDQKCAKQTGEATLCFFSLLGILTDLSAAAANSSNSSSSREQE